MGEILQLLYERRDALVKKKAQIQAINIAEISAKITKLNTIIAKIEAGGWDT